MRTCHAPLLAPHALPLPASAPSASQLKHKASKAPRNANPMAKRAATGLRAKPMPATATTMVR